MSNKKLTYEQQRVYDLLKSRNEYYTNNELSLFTGYDTRTIRQIIQSLRLKHIPIASNNNGYILDKNETKITIAIMNAHIKTLIQTRNALQKSIK